MARDQAKITEVINSLSEGDEVQVVWAKSGHRSVETGKVWNPADSAYWGLGPDLLNPADTQLFSITVKKRVPQVPSQPTQFGTVAVWYTNSSFLPILAAQKVKKGWVAIGSSQVFQWSFLAQHGTPAAIFTPGSKPAAPTINTATGGSGTITIAATLGSDNGYPISDVKYRLNYSTGGDDADTGWISSGQATGNFVIEDLAPATEYTVRIQSVNLRGESPDSNSRIASTT